jgi:hypothetical protein
MARVELQDHLADGDRLEQKAAARIAFGSQAQLDDGRRRVRHLAQRLAGALMPVGLVRLLRRDLQIKLGRFGVLLLLDRLRGLVLQLAEIDFGHLQTATL